MYPGVYFVIGRFSSGGTVSAHGLVIGAEMCDDPGRLALREIILAADVASILARGGYAP